jgi:acetamidase/formamidase
VLTIEPGDSIVFSAPDAGWGIGPPVDSGGTRDRFEPRDPELDAGHPLIGPVEVRGVRAGDVLVVDVDEVRVGTWGITDAGGWSTPLNERLGVAEGEPATLVWELDAEAALGRDQAGRAVALRPFLGVIGMPPAEAGVHPTGPPRVWGGNIDCKELVSGSTLYLPIPVDGAFLSAGDGHAAQGDGEVAGWAIETPVEAQLTLEVRDDLQLEWPIARTADAWLAFGFDEDLGQAARFALAGILAVMKRELGITGGDALVLASVGVDLRITQVVNETQGVHAVLRDDAFR